MTVYAEQFFETIQVAKKKLAAVFHSLGRSRINFDKKGLGNILVDFLTNPSDRPGEELPNCIPETIKAMPYLPSFDSFRCSIFKLDTCIQEQIELSR
jgi:hypothetical protein